MGQRVIPVAVTAEYIGGDGVTLGAAGSHNSVLIEYDFRSAGPQWDDSSGRYVLWTNPQGNSTNRINLGVSEKVEGYEGVYQAAPPADAMCVPGWAEMVVVGFTMDGDKEVTKIKTEPSRFRVLPGSSRAADNEGVAPTVADQLQAEIEEVDKRLSADTKDLSLKKVNKPVAPLDPDGKDGQFLVSRENGKTEWVDMDPDLVEEALARHPDWVTTVEDGAVSIDKLSPGAIESLNTDAAYQTASYYNLKEIPNAYQVHTFEWLQDGDNISYGQQGMAVTDRYVVLAGNAVNAGDLNDTRFYVYVLDKNTYQAADLGSVSNPIFVKCADLDDFPEKFHANNVAWVERDNEIFVFNGGDNQIAAVFDATTFVFKRVDDFGSSWNGQTGYDNKTDQWVAVTWHTAELPYLHICIYDHDRHLVREIRNIKRMGVMQSVTFDDGLIYLPQSCTSAYNADMGVAQNILVIDQHGNLVRSWWFKNGENNNARTDAEEIEDMGVIRDGVMLIATNGYGFGTNNHKGAKLFEMPYRVQNSVGDLREYDRAFAGDFFRVWNSQSVDRDLVARFGTPDTIQNQYFEITAVNYVKYGHIVMVKVEGFIIPPGEGGSMPNDWVKIATGMPISSNWTLATNIISDNGKGMIRVKVEKSTGDLYVFPRFLPNIDPQRLGVGGSFVYNSSETW